jgi:hypothetical protein
MSPKNDGMSEERLAQLRAILLAYDERAADVPELSKAARREAERQRRAAAERLRAVVRPVLQAVMTELRSAGHDAMIQDSTESSDAHPSVALTFTPMVRGLSQGAFASVLAFRYDPRRGIVVQRDIRMMPARGRAISTSVDRGGTIGPEALTAEWAETKTLTFVDAVLKAN